MKRYLAAAAMAALAATGATAGGIDRSGQSISALFEPGNYVEFSFGSAAPDVSGTGAGAFPNPAQPTPGASSGSMSNRLSQFGTALKMPLGDSIDLAFIFDQPFGADVTYPAGTGYFAAGASASAKSTAMTGLLRYKFNENFSVHGGLRYQTFGAEGDVPYVASWKGVAGSDGGFGYVVGAAYERPDIALRVALTYNSRVEHNMPTNESSVFGTSSSITTVETPQSVNLDFQTGIAKDTLLFGGVRWVEWSKFEIAPQDYVGLTGQPLVSYENDFINYSLGIGRRLNDNWSGAVTIGYEPAVGGFASNLGPTDGYTSLGLAATYTQGGMKLTAGVRHVWIGDAKTRLGLATTLPAANFEDNTALAFGMKVSFAF